MEVPGRGGTVGRPGSPGIRYSAARHSRQGGETGRRVGVDVAILRTGDTALAIAVVVVFAFPDQSWVKGPCKSHKGSLVRGHHRTIHVARVGEEPATIHRTHAVTEIRVELRDRGQR